MSQLPPHLIPMVRRMRGMPTRDPPSPWRRVGSFAVGGLAAVGFASNTDLLLVVSSPGRGVFDCLEGQKIDRDPSDSFHLDEIALEADGIGPSSGQRIRLSGIYGGGLPHLTRDGWSAEAFALDWPEVSLVLVPPGSWAFGDAFGKPADYVKVAVESEVRAWGFSPTGKSLILATSSDLTVFAREHLGSEAEQVVPRNTP